TGKVEDLKLGREILDRAVAQYVDPNTGLVKGVAGSKDTLSEVWSRPQIIDGPMEAPSTALLSARVFYSQLEESATGAKHRAEVASAIGRLAPVVNGLRGRVGGFLMLAEQVQASPPVLVCGGGAVGQGLALSKAHPSLTFIPVVKGCGAWESLAEGCYRLESTGPVAWSPAPT
ncbi:MAG: hypothetical protein ABUL49_00270, partial [bacterium]